MPTKSSVRGLVIHVGGVCLTRLFKRKKDGDMLKEMQVVVGGLIETINIPGGGVMVVNEEGKLASMPINEVATQFCRKHDALRDGDFIVGDVILFGRRGGGFTEVSASVVAQVSALARRAE